MKNLKLKDRPIFKKLIDKGKNLMKNGKPILGNALAIIGDLTGKQSLETLGNLIGGSKDLSGDEIADAQYEIGIDLQKFEIEEANKTERWKYDMQSDSFMSKNIRPYTVATVVILLVYVIIAGIHGKTMSDAYVGMFSVIVTTVIGGYFTLRWDEKRKAKNK